MTAMPEPYRFTVAQYHAMMTHRILGDSEPCELLHGLILRKKLKSPRWCYAKGLTEDALRKAMPDGWHAWSCGAITTATSEPEPSVLVARGEIRTYATRHPYPEDVALVVEVSEETRDFDRGWKKRLYADARLPVYWIVDVVENVVEVHADPHGSGDAADYATVHTYRPGDAVPLSVGGVALPPIPVADLLP